jgi:hypothetical protein
MPLRLFGAPAARGAVTTWLVIAVTISCALIDAGRSVSVMVTGPVAEDLVLEIGPTAWWVRQGEGGGMATIRAASEVPVRLVTLDCRVLASTVVDAGTNVVFRVVGVDRITVETGSGPMDLGPALGGRPTTGCP